jgi:hypothetical protein
MNLQKLIAVIIAVIIVVASVAAYNHSHPQHHQQKQKHKIGVEPGMQTVEGQALNEPLRWRLMINAQGGVQVDNGTQKWT